MSFSMCVSVKPIEPTVNDDSYSRYESWQMYGVFKPDPTQDSISKVKHYYFVKIFFIHFMYVMNRRFTRWLLIRQFCNR